MYFNEFCTEFSKAQVLPCEYRQDNIEKGFARSMCKVKNSIKNW